MSVTQEEIKKVEEWLAELYGTTPDKCPVSRETIRKIFRGPMKEILSSFLVPKFRTDEQVKTVRSNLFLHDVDGTSLQQVQQEKDRRYKQEIKELEEKVAKVQEEKQEVTERILELLDQSTASNSNLGKKVLATLSTYEKVDLNLSQTDERVRTSTELLENAQKIMPSCSSSSDPKSIDAEKLMMQREELISLYTNASDLFNDYCGANGVASNATSSSELETLVKEVDTKTRELAQSGLSPMVVESWAITDQTISLDRLETLESEFENVMNPANEYLMEVDHLYKKLMEIHVMLWKNNEILTKQIRRLSYRLDKKIWKAIENGGVDFDKLSELLQESKANARSEKLKEMNDLVARWEAAMKHNEDLLQFIGSWEKNPSLDSRAGGSRRSDGSRVSLDADTLCSQETREKITAALLKSYPVSKQGLEVALKNSKLLMLNMFPELCGKLRGIQKGNEDFISAQTSTPTQNLNDIASSPAITSTLSEKSVLQNSFSAIESNVDMKSPDYLSEILKLQLENEKKAKECDLLLQELKLVPSK